MEDLIQKWVREAKSAPSADNTQPWQLVYEVIDTAIQISIQLSSECISKPSEIDTLFSASYMALGTLAKNLELLASQDGYLLRNISENQQDNVTSFTLRLEKSTNLQANPLAKFISLRNTNRLPFKSMPLQSEHRADLTQLHSENITAKYISVDEIKPVSKIMTKLDRMRYIRKNLYYDFIKKMRFGSETPKSRDGLAGVTLGVPVPLRVTLYLMRQMKFLWFLNYFGMQYISSWMGCHILLKNSSGIIALQGNADTPRGWFNLGMEMQNTWLELTARQISVQPMGGTLLIYRSSKGQEDKAMMNQLNLHLKDSVGLDGTKPLILMRVGYAVNENPARSLRKNIQIKKTNSKSTFDYATAFSRNLGWVSANEQEKISQVRVAIAGMGGVGGEHLITLVRLGFTKFHLADFDAFSIENFNRQTGANISTIGKSKLEVMTEQAMLINPDLEIKKFPSGINNKNMNEFLNDVDVYVDGLDAFVLDVRSSVFAHCYKMNIPAVTVAPLAMGAALINFIPGKMSFEEYFGLNNRDDQEQVGRFILGLSPSLIHRKSVIERKYFQLANKKGPSTVMGCKLSTGVLGTEVLKIVLNRGNISAAPQGLHFDAYANKYKKTWMPFGKRNPLFLIKLFIFKKLYMAPTKENE